MEYRKDATPQPLPGPEMDDDLEGSALRALGMDDDMGPLEGYVLGSGHAHGTAHFSVMRHGHPTDAPARHVSVKSVMRAHPRFVEADVRREIALLEKLSHPQCAMLVEVKEDAARLHIVEEIGAGGEMLDRIVELGSFSEAEAVHLIHQVPALIHQPPARARAPAPVPALSAPPLPSAAKAACGVAVDHAPRVSCFTGAGWRHVLAHARHHPPGFAPGAHPHGKRRP